ncbi:MAG: pilin [Chromohalobacter sp.]|nr:pilin [Chromohalobacter sp.]MCI0592203.1 pilin [Chromohalobacter sp.]
MARSQFAEAHSLLGGAKISIQERVDQGATFTSADDLGIRTEGEYGAITDVVGVSEGGNANGPASVTYTFGSGTTSASSSLTAANANTVTYTYAQAQGDNFRSWSCTTTVPEQYVSNCTSTAGDT